MDKKTSMQEQLELLTKNSLLHTKQISLLQKKLLNLQVRFIALEDQVKHS